jgi:hypothetical protein
MALGGKMHDRLRSVPAQQFRYERTVPDIPVREHMPRIIRYALQILDIAGIGQLIEIDDRVIGLGKPFQYEVRSDEPGPAGH